MRYQQKKKKKKKREKIGLWVILFKLYVIAMCGIVTSICYSSYFCFMFFIVLLIYYIFCFKKKRVITLYHCGIYMPMSWILYHRKYMSFYNYSTFDVRVASSCTICLCIITSHLKLFTYIVFIMEY